MREFIFILIAGTVVIAILAGLVAWLIHKGASLVKLQFASKAIGKFELLASKGSDDLIVARDCLVSPKTKTEGIEI